MTRPGGRRAAHADDDPAAPVPVEDVAVRHAKVAVYVVFVSAGFIYASWASRIPQIRAELQVGPGALGLVLLCGAVGSTLGTPLSDRKSVV